MRFGESLSFFTSKKDVTPRDMPVYKITRLETTGNGATMVHLVSVQGNSTQACWQSEFVHRWLPAPKPPRVPKPKPDPTSRFERILDPK